MASPLKRHATYEDLLKVPDNKVAEIIDGELYVSPRPAARHARASSRLGGALDPFDVGGPDSPGRWWILDEPELRLGPDTLVPDLAGWRRERMPEIPDVAFFTLAPDWVCEVTSPSTEQTDRAKKMPIYLRENVAHVWIVQPITRTLEVYRLGKDFSGVPPAVVTSRWMLIDAYGGDVRVRAEPFDAMELDLGRLWMR